jgi:hypothetical protein
MRPTSCSRDRARARSSSGGRWSTKNRTPHLADAAAQADGDKVVRAKVTELLDNSPFIRKADTLTELARKMEVDVGAFLATIERYNGACKQGLEHEPEFGKPLKSSKPFDTPPYYAVQIFPLARKTSAAPRPICNAACSTSTSSRSPASTPPARSQAWPAATSTDARGSKAPMLGPSIFSGRVAGGWAAHAAGHGRGFVGKPNRN